MPYSAAYWIDKLGMESHVEGGAFTEIYRSPLLQKKEDLPPAFNGDRNYATAIYFLLQQGQFSAFHRIASDELWHFYAEDPIEIFEINSRNLLHYYPSPIIDSNNYHPEKVVLVHNILLSYKFSLYTS